MTWGTTHYEFWDARVVSIATQVPEAIVGAPPPTSFPYGRKLYYVQLWDAIGRVIRQCVAVFCKLTSTVTPKHRHKSRDSHRTTHDTAALDDRLRQTGRTHSAAPSGWNSNSNPATPQLRSHTKVQRVILAYVSFQTHLPAESISFLTFMLKYIVHSTSPWYTCHSDNSLTQNGSEVQHEWVVIKQI